MFEGFSLRTIDFIWNLRLNNNKAWFTENKEEFRQAFYIPMKELEQEVYERTLAACGDRGFIHKVSRIYKDARRVKGGEPYKDHLWLSIEKPREEQCTSPVFWFELTPDSWSYGMGYYQTMPQIMAKFRARADKYPKDFEKLIKPLEKQDEFVLQGPEYVRKKTAPTKKIEPWYNKKFFSLIHEQSNGEEIFSRELADRIVDGFTFLMPIYDYLISVEADPEPAEK